MISEGLTTDIVAVNITREKIRNYCKVVGERNPIFYNLEDARTAGYADLVLPATYPVLFWKYIDIPWLKNQSPIIQSGQKFAYDEALVANETYTCQIRLVKVRQKGNKQFLQHELCINRDGKTVATSNTTLVLIRGWQ